MDCDYRRLFSHKTLRNAIRWNDIPRASFLGPMQRQALGHLSNRGIITLKESVNPFDDIFPKDETRCEFIAYRPPVVLFQLASDPEYYYVNTEGFTFACYTYRIPENLMLEILHNQ